MKILLAALLLCIAMAPQTARAANTPPANGDPTTITVDAGSGRVLQLGSNASSIFAADPKVAEARPASPTSLFIFGVSPGRTTIAALNAAGTPIAQYQVVVRPSGFGAGEAEAAIARV